jgi:RNA polymerase sigma factor (sigma-70 family)
MTQVRRRTRGRAGVHRAESGGVTRNAHWLAGFARRKFRPPNLPRRPPLIPLDTYPEQVFVENLPLIERIIAAQVRRHALVRPDADDYASWAKAKLIDGNYAILRKFGGRSALSTFLTSVLANLFADYRNSQWGRWRPSAAATRLGPIAVRLEELIYRDGCALREASETLRAAGAALSESEIARLAAAIPARERVHEVSIDSVVRAEAEPSADVSDWERREAARTVEKIVQDLVDTLPPDDGLIVRMRFWSDQSVADISRVLQIDQKGLYRRLDAIRLRLNRELQARGIDRAAVAELLQGAER